MGSPEKRAEVFRTLQSLNMKHAQLYQLIKTGSPGQIPLIHSMLAEISNAISNLVLYADPDPE